MVASSADGSRQPVWFWAPTSAEPVPLLVELHSWSMTCDGADGPNTYFLKPCQKAGWAIVIPNFRGANETPQACGSDLAVQDVMDAVAAAKKRVKIDGERVYLAGGSGGGMMALLLAGRHPEAWAACSAACPISDLVRWHAESRSFSDWRAKYADMIEKCCGGTPVERRADYLHRSPVTWLGSARNLPIDICEGIHDGHVGSVPVGHSLRAFNILANEPDRLSDAEIDFIQRNESVPPSLAGSWSDPFFSQCNRIYFRRVSRNARITLFEGGHSGNFSAAFDWLSRQRRSRPADWTVPATGAGQADAVSR